NTLRFGEVVLDLVELGDDCARGPPPSYNLIIDLVLILCHRMMAHSIAGRSQAPEKFIARLAEHFGLLTAEILGGLTVIVLELPIIDMGELDAPAADEGDQAVLAPVQAPQQLPPPPPATARTMPQTLGRLKEEVQELHRDIGSLHGLVERLMTDQGRFSTWMMSCMAQLMDASGLTYREFDGTFQGSSPLAFQRCTRQRIGEASTFAAQQDPQ
ncbi:hypothetical protein Tco_1526319, partial [Tanacetum coccineum]